MIQYMVHKVSVALFSGLLFVLNWKVMSCNYREYGVYLGLAYLLTAIISIALIIFAVSAKSHKLILAIVRHFNKSGRLTPALTKLEQSCDIMEKSTSKLLKDVPSLISMVLKNMAKLCFWYCVPFLILFGSNEISLLDSLSITSLSVMTAAVIPTPAGIRSRRADHDEPVRGAGGCTQSGSDYSAVPCGNLYFPICGRWCADSDQ